ncbi:MAG: hypothetical protein Q7K43_05690, partial [Candidatus Woesearchaeota archaeon]|nr:hypothetical protein [Candidatus Woesearchaeota archaeon]
MKKAMFAVMMIFVFVLATAASAAIEFSVPTFGSKTTVRGTTLTATFSVKNTENDTITGLSMSHTANSKYNVSLTGLPSFLNASQSATVTLSLLVSKDHPAIDSVTLNEQAIDIADITISGTRNGTQVTNKGDLFVQAENQLNLKKVRVNVKDGKSDTV